MCNCPCQTQSFVKNPDQITLGFKDTRFPEVYEDAYQTGLTWDANWMPGGPHVYTGTKLPKLREADETKFQVWHEGFKAGLKIRLENEHFATWWKENHRIGGQYRYTDPNQPEPELN